MAPVWNATRAFGRPLALCLALVSLGGCSPLGIGNGTGVAACEAPIDRGVLPEWARAGFSEPDPQMPHVVGRAGDIVAILFGDPLSAPPAPDRNNKILWVAKRIEGASDLRITAQRMDGTVALGQAVERTVSGGPGPSIVDMPVAGCWRLALAWGAVSDSVDLEYAGPRPSSSP
jgi:hypothetical protein